MRATFSSSRTGETQTEFETLLAGEVHRVSRPPPLPFGIDAGGIKVPAKYLSQQLIYNGRRGPAIPQGAGHPASRQLERGEGSGRWHFRCQPQDQRQAHRFLCSIFYKLQLREIAKIATFEHEVEAAKAALRAAELALDLERAALDLARKAVDEAQDIIEKNPEIINVLTGQISVTLNSISDASGLVGNLSAAKQKAVDDLNGAQQKLTGLVCNVQKQVCGEITIGFAILFRSPVPFAMRSRKRSARSSSNHNRSAARSKPQSTKPSRY